ncbi:MAG: ArsR family transcriptional regulator, partial [Ghiorsea sp.]|nr:ArsR family transcriptional regulator [Ghiorsea sp.]
MSFEDIKQQDRRFLMLKALATENDYTISDMVLKALLKDFGHTLSRDAVRSDLAWLEELGLVSAEQVAGLTIVKITPRGVDVSEG